MLDFIVSVTFPLGSQSLKKLRKSYLLPGLTLNKKLRLSVHDSCAGSRKPEASQNAGAVLATILTLKMAANVL